MTVQDLDPGRDELGWSDAEGHVLTPKRGIDEDIIGEMSWVKGEPSWMLQHRLEAYRRFLRRPMPSRGGDLSDISFDRVSCDIEPTEGQVDRREGLPDAIRETDEKLGIPEAQGVIFCDMDTALREHPELVKEHFGTVVPEDDDKFASLNSAVWSGGSFIYVPPGVEVAMPLQASFRINTKHVGQFARTLIIADEGSKVHHIEGCSAPTYTTDSLRSAVVEIIVKPSARVTCTTIQNWSNNVFNLVTKRAKVEAEGHVEWIDGNIGSRLTRQYPAVWLVGPKATGEVLSVAYAGGGQHQDTGAEMVHAAPETSSKVVSKCISSHGGRTSYRGLVRVEDDAYGCKSHVQCDALILDEGSVSDTYPTMEVGSHDARIGHEATVSRVADEQLFYLMSRGLTEEQAMGTVVNGFIEPVTRTLPMEYAVEWSRLIELQMEGSVG